MDVCETEDYFEILVDVPGKSSEDIVVYVNNGFLHIVTGPQP